MEVVTGTNPGRPFARRPRVTSGLFGIAAGRQDHAWIHRQHLEEIIFFPDLSTELVNVSYVVGAGIEHSLAVLDVDVGNDTISIDYTAAFTTADGAFNGFRWSDVGGTVSRIQSVTMSENVADPDLTNDDLTWDENNIYLNLASIDFLTTSLILLDINFHPDAVDDDVTTGESGTGGASLLANDSDKRRCAFSSDSVFPIS